MTDTKQSLPDHEGETDADRRNANIFLVVCFLVLLGAAYWLIDALLAQRAVDNCVGQGRRNCAPIVTPDR